MIKLPPFREERLLYTRQASSKVRTISKYVTKIPYYFTIPVFSIENTWRGASEIIRKYYYTLEKDFSILESIGLPSDGNYIPCIAWKPTVNTIVRYKLWHHDEGLLYIPLYDGRKISKNFYLEIWSTDNALIAGGGKQLKISQFKIPLILCEYGEIDLAPIYATCNDMTFDMSNFDSLFGDYYSVINTCLDTQQVFGIDTPEVTIDLASAFDNVQVSIINQEAAPDFYEIWKKTKDLDWFLLITIDGDDTTYLDLSILEEDFWQFKVKAKIGDNYSEFSDAAGISNNHGFLGTGDLDISSLVLTLSEFYLDDGPSVTNLNLSKLRRVNGNLTLGSMTILESVNLDSLDTVLGDLDVSIASVLTELNLPLLNTITGFFSCSISELLNILSFPVITNINGNFSCDSCEDLTSITLSDNYFFPNGTTLAYDNCALDVTTVNAILARGAVSGITTCNIDLSGGTSSPPSGQGIIDKDALIAAGNTVSTN